MEALFSLVVIPLALFAVKVYVDQRNKKQERAQKKIDTERAEMKKKKAAAREEIERRWERSLSELYKKIDVLEDKLPLLETRSQNREDHKEIWVHFRKEVEDLKEKVAEIRGRLHDR